MAEAYTPKVNSHVTYFDAACKPRPAIVTSVTNSTTVNLRIGHSATKTGIVRQVTGHAANTWKRA